jgi:hypothetical protein
MHNQNAGEGSAQAAPQADDQAPVADAQGPILSLQGEGSDPLTSEELAHIAQQVKDGGAVETTIRGQRVLIVGDCHNHRLSMAHLALLAEADALLVRPDQHLVALDRVALDEQVLRLKAPEIVVAEFDAGDERKGKGKRRREWESPYGSPAFKQHNRPPQHNIKQMLRRRGGR